MPDESELSCAALIRMCTKLYSKKLATERKIPMRRWSLLLAAVLCLNLVLTGCGKKEADRPWKDTVVYSTLNDDESRKILEQLLISVPTDEEQRQVLFEHINQINGFLEPDELTDGFEEIPITQPKYNPYDIQERWEKKYSDFPGYNCRITAYSVGSSLIHIQKDTTIGDPDYIMMDLFSLESDSTAIPNDNQMMGFQALYTGIETENTQDISIHVHSIQDNWKERHIFFEDGGVSLISVFFHDQIDGNKLFVGHTGLLFEREDGLYFLEKLAFQEPYQLVKVDSRGELSDYLMTKYDVEFNQTMAPPIVMENAQLIEGYRSMEK